MNNKTTYTDENIEFKVIDDFLPSPADLTRRDDKVKVTLNLSRKSVGIFKKLAQKHHTVYQKMIRNLLDDYAKKFEGEV